MKRWGIELLLVAVVTVWGINYTIGKYGVAELTSIDFTAMRMVIAAPILLLITYWIERSLKIDRKDFMRLTLTAMVGITLYQTLFMEMIKYISAANASLIISVSPIFTTIFALLFRQEKFSFQKLIGSFTAFIGAALVLLAGDHTGQSQQIIVGSIIGVLTSMCWGLYPILANPLIKKYTPLRVTAWSAVIGALPLVVLSGTDVFFTAFTLQPVTWFSLLYSVFFVTVFGLVVWYIGIQKIGSTNTMVYMYLTPLTAVIFAAIWIDEHIYLQQIVGGFIIFIGLWIVKYQKKRIAAPEPNFKN
ncbi:DMT family transporter [Metabacillus idriensis]|uniref:DMT family transporter n=1 Tax=Metabacillus idriensis TaxID=324768 RepID=UPI00174A3CF3|nr:DMT family transporter [Metabacillus idriensis]